ncbi:MAG: hypothetical protein HPY58_05470 [Firmicutes bacterium]|nr:hypothetical protein [Bacillota bacterium]
MEEEEITVKLREENAGKGRIISFSFMPGGKEGMNWRRLLLAGLTMFSLLSGAPSAPASARAAAPVRVFVNGQQVFFPDVEPIIVQGRTLVPIRFLAETPAFEAAVAWEPETRQVTLTRGATAVVLWPGSPNVFVNGRGFVLDVPPVIRQGRTLVPLRFLSEAFGAAVTWDGVGRRVLITICAQEKVVLGYYYGGSYQELLERYMNLTDVAFRWYEADETGNLVFDYPQAHHLALDFARQQKIRTQASVALFDPEKLHILLNSREARAALISSLVNLVREEGHQAVNLDFEFVRPEDRGAFNTFLAELSQALKQVGADLVVAVPAKVREVPWHAAYDYGEIGKYADRIVLMAYDYSYRTGAPGPIAPYDWVERVIAYARQFLPPDKILLGLGLYGYDWPEGKDASSLTFRQAEALAAAHQTFPAWDPVSCLPHFTYVDEAGVKHEVWYENRASLKAKLDLARDQGLAGVSLWRLGLGFPEFWEDLAAAIPAA